MAELKLYINDIELKDTEIPETLAELGGTQAMGVHDFPGGIRTIQSLGPFPAPLEWKGVLLGEKAFDRVMELNKLRVEGSEVAVIFGPFKLVGMIKKLFFKLKSQWIVDYDIIIEIRKDMTEGTAGNDSGTSDENTMNQLQSALTEVVSA